MNKLFDFRIFYMIILTAVLLFITASETSGKENLSVVEADTVTIEKPAFPIGETMMSVNTIYVNLF
jgi:hypothetical protein